MKGTKWSSRTTPFAAIALLGLLYDAHAATFHVDSSVSQSGNGSSWATAFKTIQKGIDAASEGDAVIVAQGTYIENIDFKGKNIVLRSTDPVDPNVVGATVINRNEGGSVVTFAGTESESCVLSGFTIRSGNGEYGGGICGGSDKAGTRATIRDNVITGNAGVLGGGLCYCHGTIERNAIRGNSASTGGGGLWNCDGAIQNNTITGNSGDSGGGLSFCDGTIQNNTIGQNFASWGGGGGLFACHGTIQNNIITGNWAQFYANALANCGATIQNNTVVDNLGELQYAMYECWGAIRNCIIWGNNRGAWASQMENCSPPSFSCIQWWMGGGEGNIALDPGFVDADGPDGDPDTFADNDYRLQADSPCIDAGVNYYWSAGPQRDLDGNCRIHGTRVDMGCYEYGAAPDADGDLLPDGDEVVVGTDPNLEDTDGDGLRDGLELFRGTSALQPTAPEVVKVPAAVRTIQKALCLALNGDEIVVSPGTYAENLQFCGADVILRSSHPRNPAVVASTIIDGRGAGPAVRFMGTESESCILSGLTIRNGRGHYGGGISGGNPHRATRARIENNIVASNWACEWGGGLYCCAGAIRNNAIAANSAGRGGGLYGCDGEIRNNVITGNWAQRDSGGLGYCNGMIQNNTITANTAGFTGGGLEMCKGTIVNCIIWGNSADYDAQLSSCGPTVYCCIILDPKFVDPDGPDQNPETYEDNDYRLAEASPCIDAGRNDDWMWNAADLDGNPRVWRGRSSLTVDVGAYEYNSSEFRVVEASKAAGSCLLAWKSRPGDTYTVWSSWDLMDAVWSEEASVSSQGDLTSWTGLQPIGRIKFYRVELTWFPPAGAVDGHSR